MSENNGNLKTPEGRVSFPRVFEKNHRSGKYELTLVFPKDTDLSLLQAAAREAVKAKWGDKIPSGLRNPFRKVSDKMSTYGEDFDPGDVFVCFRSQNRQPMIVDAAVQPIMTQSDFYPGCWARVSTNAYAYDREGNKGVAFGLINIQKIRADDPLAGILKRAFKPEDDFERVLADSSEDLAAFGTDDDIFGSDDDDISF